MKLAFKPATFCADVLMGCASSVRITFSVVRASAVVCLLTSARASRSLAGSMSSMPVADIFAEKTYFPSAE